MKKEIKKIESGDRTNFDFEGSINGKLFSGGSSKGFTLVIGSNQFIPGFEEQMIGMCVGDIKNLKVPFPKNYHAKDLAGKMSNFKVTINSIKKKR